MNLKEIKDLIETFNKSETTKIKIKQDSFEIELEKNTSLNISQAVAPAVASLPTTTPASTPTLESINTPTHTASTSGDFILSPMVGTFYQCPSPGAAPYIKVGDVVKKGQTIGIVEAMKIMNEIEAEYDCKILSIEANDAQPVEFGSKLVKVERI